MLDLSIRPVIKEIWADFEKLFQSKGAPSYCWCASWRMSDKELKDADSAGKKAFMIRRVEAGTPVGLLAYDGDEPVAWCSVAPRETYRKLGGDEKLPNVWSIACFFIKKDYRKKGIVSMLIESAKSYAKDNGADVVEAFPVEPDSPSYRHMGFIETFEKAGFDYTHMAGSRRHVMIYKLQ